MLRSLFAGVSGLRSHQQMMDVVGNNIANVNTTGFKSSSVVFQDLLSQVMQGSTAGNATTGGTNPAQIGLGTRIAAITQNFAQGALQNTGKSTDVAIQGDGFFVVQSNNQQMYTRGGNFEFDQQGSLVTENGAFVQGWMADANGVTDTTGLPVNLKMTPGQLIDPVKTTKVTMGNMLSADATVGSTATTTMEVFDSQGNSNNLKFNYTKTATNTWSVETLDGSGTSLGSATLTFNPATGELASQTPATYSVSPLPAANWPTGITIGFGDANDPNRVKEFGGTTTVAAMQADGSATGFLQSFKIGNDGSINGTFSNGESKKVGQLALANFTNPSGLEKAGDSTFRNTPNSGNPQIGTPGSGGRGKLSSGTLEMSNVDLSQEFTNLIIAQRGFQANSKVITTSDDILQELLSLKR